MEDLMNIDIYELFGIPLTADERKIKKAYRKKALTCHPDKNPDNPQAASLFLQLSQALELLLDKSKRTAYDKHYNAKKAAAIRHQQLDSKCKKLKEDLEIKERLAQFGKSGCRTKEQRLSEEIERLRKEGSQQLKEEMESLRQTIYNESLFKTKAKEAEDSIYRLKIRWKSKKNDSCNGYDNEKLIQLFSKYGNIAVLIVSKNKGGSALIEFETGESALKAYNLEKGYPENPLKLSWLNGEPPPLRSCGTTDIKDNNVHNEVHYAKCNESNPTFSPKNTVYNTREERNVKFGGDESDFEAFVFAKLREAEDRKKNPNPT
ncbi:dnaJ homolog subfamily C member 17 [Rhodnius prolixus]|uniref:Putative molecular chaperone dnaj superfamily n=1 Tax=Rhodnius prolixus TaxID=13249 RepID=R4FMM3_RHOPR